MSNLKHKSLAVQDQKNTLFDKFVFTCTLDLDYKVIDASRAFIDFLGYDNIKSMSSRYKFFSTRHVESSYIDNVKNTLELSQTFVGELKNTKVNSEEFYVRMTISQLKNENGEKIAYMSILENITHEKRLKEISITDPLTQLYNRAYFDIYLKQRLYKSIKQNEVFSLVLIDIDCFKAYNESHGHIMGDKTIVQVASILKNNKYVDPKKLFRVSGEEYAIIVVKENSGYLKALVDSIFESIKLLDIKHESSDVSDILTVSAGIVSINTSIHHVSASELMNLADNNLKKAKDNGRNQAVYDVDTSQNDEIKKINLVSALPNREVLLNDLAYLENNSMIILLHLNHISTLKNIYGLNGVTNVIANKTDKLNRLLLDKEATLYNLNYQEFAILVTKESLHEKYLSLIIYSVLEDTMVDVGSFDDSTDSLVTFTAGIAYGINNILNNADIILQEAILNKKSYLIYDHESHEGLAKIDIMSKMRVYKKALVEGGIIPFFQPIVDANTGEIFKYEALARLINDEGEIVTPYHFINESKEDKTFEAFTKQMMQKVFNVYSKNRINISINVTYENILSKSMISYMKNRLDKYGGEGITFEIVESEEILDYSLVEEFILMIKSYGCKVSIDDFGSGYSNFTNILLLNIDYVKIDGSLIEKLHIDDNVVNIVKALIVFTKGAGMKTIAEFVSSNEISKMVQELGIDYSQGYYYSEPKSPTELGLKFDEI